MKKLFLILLLLLQIPTIFGQNQSEDPSSKKLSEPGTWIKTGIRNGFSVRMEKSTTIIKIFLK